jgi:integrase
MKEYGRSLRLDDEAEKKLLAGAAACNWRKRSLQLFRDIIILMRDTGMRNERELYRMRIENLDWETRVIFVPDSKTEEGRRRVPMNNRVFDILKQRCGERREGWGFPIETRRVFSPHHNGEEISRSQGQSWASRRSCPLLWAARLRHPDSEENRKPGCRHENHGPQGCEDCHAVSASRARDRARCARSGHSSRETGVAGLSYGTLYGTPKTPTPVSD